MILKFSLQKNTAFILSISLLIPFSAFALTPNDPSFEQQAWYLDQIRVRDAWGTTTGATEVVVAVIDDGIDMQHPDLITKIWENTDEIAGNAIDDDGNGYVDDTYGYNFSLTSGGAIQNRNEFMGQISNRAVHRLELANELGLTFQEFAAILGLQYINDDQFIQDYLQKVYSNHGTPVASLIAASPDNYFGMAGVHWQAKLMNLPIFELNDIDEGIVQSVPGGFDVKLTAAIRYAVDNGADVINLSLGGEGTPQTRPDLEAALKYAYDKGVPIIVSAGNGNRVTKLGRDLVVYPQMPACSKYVLTVGATNSARARTSFSDYGSCVDVYAPGQDIAAAYFGLIWITDIQEVQVTRTWVKADGTGDVVHSSNGTSFSAPLVAGVVALLKSIDPYVTTQQIYDRIIETANTPVLNSYNEFIVDAAGAVSRGAFDPVLYRGSDGVHAYLLNRGQLRLVPDEATFVAKRYAWADVKPYDPLIFARYPIGGDLLPEGALVRAFGDIDVYIVKYVGAKGFKRLVLSPTVFESYGHLRWENVRDVTTDEMSALTTSNLVRAAGDDRVWRLYPDGDIGERHWISTATAFTRLQLDSEAIYEINSVDRNSYTLGAAIN
ncbi:MAG: hypothetical protein A3A97_01210 [Candidatus Terrybacteria bacterium RIFCSPLOWO2_01_FULL_40_23]|uniref:Peptidase S8/S53 domain-containing protein n=1 Tax=Candidatus Terrybacteria bacterium RIFCSPLOWO2_01_FULL_40_23 TaxID=1802366 RepID=A0A1G2PWR7_9BACT|nr:MAG: hypothetical protein A3A97_01210 [Candidatus Terrybacteria bacterium RIFCSPLOWO2_01_FULL_40_23]